MLIGTMAASVNTVINLTWLPENLYFVSTAPPSALRVTVLGEGVIMDLDAAGILALANIRCVSRVLNAFLLNLSDGLIKNKNVEISFFNTTAVAIPLFGFSERIGGVFVQSIRQAVLANSGAVFSDFALIALPNLGANDTVDVFYHNGLNQRLLRDELAALNQRLQNNNGSFIFDNLDGNVTSLTVIPTAAQTAYVVRYALGNDVSGAVFDS